VSSAARTPTFHEAASTVVVLARKIVGGRFQTK
jgi:hypothetical protein